MTLTAVDHITLPEARYLTLVAQRLEWPDCRRPKKPSQDDLLATIEAAGCIQLDSISVVSRAHETAVWSRHGTYDTANLAALHYPRAELIEYWAHAASLLPVSFFPYLRRTMQRFSDPAHEVGQWAEENRDLINEVLQSIEREGPLSTRAFNRPDESARQAWDWWGGKPAKQALDYLWTMGDLVVLRRIGFERVYELTDRALPDIRSEPLPDPDDEERFFTTRALSAVGVGTLPWLADYFRCGSSRYVPAAAMKTCLDHLACEGLAYRVSLEGQTAPAWLDATLAPALEQFRNGAVSPVHCTLLSPFDNVMWRRDRAAALFGFDYRIETYTPEPLRKYGYYSLPILVSAKLVGRLDATYTRKERVLTVKALHLEPRTQISAKLASSVARILQDFTAFLGGGRIVILSSTPDTFLPLLHARMA